ncbi:sensor histidine kinase [Saccharothrix violaceirubra]|uniref:histidine kinase n=1 Tax=Saccharothrix violaceirubra TaxID=413306 RepID=A0A7W7T4J4_9PSEU|nr:histidine kinase [Saccharothrix violaceirubra]MBB4966448.1 signal transduction histidine kinase [Saccharothrix violaceirubra]
MRFHSTLVDVSLAGAFAALTITTLVTRGVTDPKAYVLAALASLPLALRQRAPVLTMCVTVAASMAFALDTEGRFPDWGIAILVSLFTVATLRPRWVAAAMFTLATLSTALMFLYLRAVLVVPEVLQSSMVLLGAWALGESTRRWGLRMESLAERAARAADDERGRIARELHDVVAHHMSVVSLQAGVARYVLDSDPDTARTAITTVADTSREALSELRRLLVVLRIDDRGELAPQPGLADLDRLVDRTRQAGVPVAVEVLGTARTLPPGQDLCAYRVTQEALTNVLKHGGRATARITLDYRRDGVLTLHVVNDGSPPPPPPPGHTPHGIQGMRERAGLYGGVVEAGPVEGGFGVVLRLPTEGSG